MGYNKVLIGKDQAVRCEFLRCPVDGLGDPSFGVGHGQRPRFVVFAVQQAPGTRGLVKVRAHAL